MPSIELACTYNSMFIERLCVALILLYELCSHSPNTFSISRSFLPEKNEIILKLRKTKCQKKNTRTNSHQFACYSAVNKHRRKKGDLVRLFEFQMNSTKSNFNLWNFWLLFSVRIRNRLKINKKTRPNFLFVCVWFLQRITKLRAQTHLIYLNEFSQRTDEND